MCQILNTKYIRFLKIDKKRIPNSTIQTFVFEQFEYHYLVPAIWKVKLFEWFVPTLTQGPRCSRGQLWPVAFNIVSPCCRGRCEHCSLARATARPEPRLRPPEAALWASDWTGPGQRGQTPLLQLQLRVHQGQQGGGGRHRGPRLGSGDQHRLQWLGDWWAERRDWRCSDHVMAGRQTSAINICIHRIIPNILKRRTCRHVHMATKTRNKLCLESVHMNGLLLHPAPGHTEMLWVREAPAWPSRAGRERNFTIFSPVCIFCLWPRVSGAECRPVLGGPALQHCRHTTDWDTGQPAVISTDQSQPVPRQQRWPSGCRQAALTAQTGHCLQSAASPAESSQPCSSEQWP